MFFNYVLHRGQDVFWRLLAPGKTFSLPSLALALLVAAVFLYVRHRRRGRVGGWRVVIRALLAKRVFVHRSTIADVAYFLFNGTLLLVIFGWGICSASLFDAFAERNLDRIFGATSPSTWPLLVLSAIVTVVLFLTYEFTYWFDHYLKHNVAFLWEAHKTHHTAETLTPLTQYRVHPLDTLIFTNLLAFAMGTVGGVLNHAFGEAVPIFAVDGKNIGLVVFVYTTQHLQHSEVWIPFRGWLGRVFVSPAHHQLHHSADPEHFNANLGGSLAIWDWLFGTLRIPDARPSDLVFGVAEPGVDPHSFFVLAFRPFGRFARAIGAVFTPNRDAVENMPAEPAGRLSIKQDRAA